MFVVVFTLLSITTLINSQQNRVVIDDFPVLEHHGCDSCERIYVPVCGTDNLTYVNPCKLNCVNSQRKPGEGYIFIQRYGPCVNVQAVFS